MGYEVILSPKALEDLESVVSYISQDNPEAALKFGKKLLREVALLKISPNIGMKVPEFEDQHIRQLIKKPYRIIYRIEEDKKRISISRFWHSSRDNLII
ncbi:MAG: type II toxin-antitoxin system RelE/ParE family toxin [Opitutales bacterium]|nr:type II toxin-antitoxin system RelE/ParE family toxin [Opitutales bacterium]